MSGELTLTGDVLAVGGIKEKIMAARRASLYEAILPVDNQSDYYSLPEHLRDGITVHFVQNYRDVARVAFSQPEGTSLNFRVNSKPAEATTCLRTET